MTNVLPLLDLRATGYRQAIQRDRADILTAAMKLQMDDPTVDDAALNDLARLVLVMKTHILMSWDAQDVLRVATGMVTR